MNIATVNKNELSNLIGYTPDTVEYLNTQYPF